MSLPLNPAVLMAAYDYLNTTLPFRRWRLPHSSEIKFGVIRSKQVRGLCWDTGKGHKIDVSSDTVGRTEGLMSTMAHEMIHVHLDRLRIKAHHGKAFWKSAALVCRYHGFDLKEF